MQKRILVLLAVLIIALLAVAGWALVPALTNTASAAAVPSTTHVTVPSVAATSNGLDALQSTLENIYTNISPSVVLIQTTSTTRTTPRFQVPGFQSPFPDVPQSQVAQALGSGFVWDTAGHIVTNNHVVAGAQNISVTFSDGTIVSAKVVGTDPSSDLAVLQVNVPAANLHPVTLADSTQLRVGQFAIAIGNPFGEENTMTTGIVSALGRSLPVQDGNGQANGFTIPDVIQTDAPINPGNSGGVLLDANGQVIGVTSAIESPSQSSAGIGFAIPSAIVKQVVPALISTGHYDHPYLGISGTSLTPDLAKAMNLPADQRGALVVDVTPNSPAQKANLRGSTQTTTIQGQPAPIGGDVIVAIDGQPIKSFDDLAAYLVRSTQVNQTITLSILRDGKPQSVQVTLAARPASLTQATTNASQPQTVAALGISAITLTPSYARAMNLSSSQQGVLVLRVASGSPADNAGLRGSSVYLQFNGQQIDLGGDVIVAVNGSAVTSVQDLQTALQQANSQTVTLTILRQGQRMNVQVKLGA
jgi:serine protease Do